MTDSTSLQALLTFLRAEIDESAPGARLPSTRRIVADHAVSPVTVSRALAHLANEGLVETRPGAGTFVADRRVVSEPADLSWQSGALADTSFNAEGLTPLLDPVRPDGAISLATGYPHPSMMPTGPLGRAWARAARLPDAFSRPPAEGLDGLRAWFARNTATGAGIEPRDVLICAGGQAAVGAAIRAVVPAGEALLVESPTYPGAIAMARAAGVRPVPVPSDSGGILPEPLARALERTRARAVYLQPTFQNPTGAVLATDRRAAVLEAARSANAFIIEDDYARWLGHGGRAPAPLIADDSDGRVIYVTSLTKVIAPSLRIGALIARGPVTERLKVLRIVEDMFVARALQETALELLTGPGWERHLRRLGAELTMRAEITLAAVRAHLPGARLLGRPHGGFHLWLALEPHVVESELSARAREQGVIINPGRPFFPAEPPGPFLRLTFTAAADAAELTEGVRRVGVALASLS